MGEKDENKKDIDYGGPDSVLGFRVVSMLPGPGLLPGDVRLV